MIGGASPSQAEPGGSILDVFQKCREFTRVSDAREAGHYLFYREIESPQDPVVTMQGQKVVMLGSMNYLGLTSHPKVKEAAIRATAKYGTGCAGSRLLNGTLDIHVHLEERLAQFMHREAALVFSTGYGVNVGVLSCLLGRRDVALLDSMDHASILDGVRLSFAKQLKFRHNEAGDLEKKLGLVDPEKGKLIAVEGVYSMEGDLAPLPEIVQLKAKYGARLFVDEAHSLGVFGEHGRGVAEHFGVEHEVDLVMGTFSKSLATVGGFIAGSFEVVDFIKHNARAQVFTAAIPPGAVAAVGAALDIIETEPERRERLWENTEYMRSELEGLGFETCGSQSPIISLLVGEDAATLQMAKRLQEEGVLVNPVMTPAVPAGHSMIRTSYMATHSREQLDKALGALAKVGRELSII